MAKGDKLNEINNKGVDPWFADYAGIVIWFNFF
jgi:hypothetical protein